MISIHQLTRKYGEFTAVDKLSFTVNSGEIVGLLGHNGAGKTTIMKMMTGFLEPTSGSIVIDDLDISQQRTVLQQKIGYLPENCPLYPEMTVIEYLDYAAILHNLPEEQRSLAIAQAIGRTDLANKALQPIHTLSRGYRQRVGVAQAILHKPDVLILDEPTNGLDPTQIQHMRRLVLELAKHSTVIISTHILQEVQAICDRVIIIRDGKKALDTRLDALQDNTRLVVSCDAPRQQVLALLMNINGIKEATIQHEDLQQQAGCTYAVHLIAPDQHQNTAAEIAQKIHEQGWKLFSLHSEVRNLESVFAEISAR